MCSAVIYLSEICILSIFLSEIRLIIVIVPHTYQSGIKGNYADWNAPKSKGWGLFWLSNILAECPYVLILCFFKFSRLFGKPWVCVCQYVFGLGLLTFKVQWILILESIESSLKLYPIPQWLYVIFKILQLVQFGCSINRDPVYGEKLTGLGLHFPFCS